MIRQEGGLARPSDDFDVAVVGAGPAGAVAAHVLASLGRRVALIDRVLASRRKIGESLPAAARPLLRDLGLLPVVENGAHVRAYGNASIWGADDLQTTDFIRDPNGLGWHLDRARFDAALREAAQASGAVWRQDRVRSAAATEHGWRLNLGRSKLDARRVIDASGRGAAFARRRGALRRTDDDLTAVFAWVTAAQADRDALTVVEACESGWWYTARLPDGTRVVSLQTDSELASALATDPEAWQKALERTVKISKLIRGAKWATKTRSTEACGSYLESPVGAGWIAAGDAAMAFDPLSSQGIFNAIYTGMRAAQTTHAALAGDLSLVSTYTKRLESIRAAYLARHKLIYWSERRWEAERFWRRRHRCEASAPLGTASR